MGASDWLLNSRLERKARSAGLMALCFALVLFAVGPVHSQSATAQSASACKPVDVELKASAGTGYQWTLSANEDRVKVLSRQIVLPSGALGGPAITHYEILPLQSGDYEIEFELIRPWEKNNQPAETKTVTISCAS